MSRPFKLRSEFTPKGDQPAAIASLIKSFEAGAQYQTLLGITGSGKTFTVANLIQKLQKPTLIMAPNKTLAAQLYAEMRDLFPDNAVAFFVSYYDYYQPEAYIPTSDTFIEKDSERERGDRAPAPFAAMNSLLGRARRAGHGQRLLHLRYRLGRGRTTRAWSSRIRVKGEEISPQQRSYEKLVGIQYAEE